MDISPFFKLMVDKGASDLFFSVGAVPHIKIEGMTLPVGQAPLKSQQMREIAYSTMNDEQRKQFETTYELNAILSMIGVGRFRISIFRQRSEIAMAVRYIKGLIPSFKELNLPDILTTLMHEMNGLILIVGSTGAGKSTTLAAMIDHRNQEFPGHILTIEDPIEYLYRHKKSIVDQREIGIDTLSYDNALKNALRSSPDVIMIGEIRERSTMKYALAYAETGHLCLSTLHATNANQALDRIVNFFPEDVRSQVLQDISLNLRAIISQRLIPGINQKRIPAVEILLNSPHISDLIREGKIGDIKDAMERSREVGMQTFDQSLFDLYQAGKISKENAIRYADSKNNVSLKIRLNEEGHKIDSNLSLQSEEDLPPPYASQSDQEEAMQ